MHRLYNLLKKVNINIITFIFWYSFLVFLPLSGYLFQSNSTLGRQFIFSSYQYLSIPIKILDIYIAFFAFFAFNFIIFLFFKLLKMDFIAKTILLIFAILYFSMFYAQWVYNVEIDHQFINLIIIHKSDLLLFVSKGWVFLFSIIFLLILWFLKQINVSLIVSRLQKIILFYIFIFAIIISTFYFSIANSHLDQFMKFAFRGFIPYDFTRALKNQIIAREKSHYKNYNVTPSNLPSKIRVIIYIMESSRASSWSLNGYYRNTNPLLSKQKNFISFNKTLSSDTSTQKATPYIASYNKKYITFKGFHDAGFKGYWISVHTDSLQGLSYLSMNFQKAYYVEYFRKNYSEYLTTTKKHVYGQVIINKFKELMPLTSKDRSFFIIHDRTTHFPADNSYPKKFDIFKHKCKLGECRAEKNYKAMINQYDNSIIYEDYLINQLLELTKDNIPTIIMGSSDHGESLGEVVNGRVNIMHGARVDKAPYEQRNIAMFFWVNDAFLKTYGYQALKNVRKNKTKLEKQGQYITQGHIFQTLYGCLNFKGQVLNSQENLCSYNK